MEIRIGDVRTSDVNHDLNVMIALQINSTKEKIWLDEIKCIAAQYTQTCMMKESLFGPAVAVEKLGD